jgi:hypothetical protein
MTVTGTLGQGVAFTWKGAAVGRGTVVRGPPKKPSMLVTTNFESAGFEEKIPGIKVGTTLHFECNLVAEDPGQWAAINDDGTIGAWTLEYASGYSFSGNGFMTCDVSSDATGLEKLIIDLEVTGTVTPSST